MLVLAACAKPAGKNASTKKRVLVTTSFLQDMVQQVAGDSVDIELMIPAGADPHLYEAKPEDHRKLQEADLVLYHGLHFEGKMVEALESKGIAVSKQFPQERLGKMDEDGEIITDPHFWFDLQLYSMAVSEATDALIGLAPEKKEDFTKAKEAYQKQLEELDAEIKTKIGSLPKESRYLITPHDAFNYFSRNYDIEVKAPQGVSTESETSNQDIQETIDFIVEHKVKAVFAESTTDPARMEKLREGVAAKGWEVKVVKGEGQELFSDSLAPKGEDGDQFITMYRHNVDLIVKNLQ
ncbi:MAG: zinc ABC transporter substrate-binding protein [Eubacteriales bacterium]|nr:zinc ABC transporter substrate-binding protein [Eubacteriales bacterium]